MLIGFAKIHKSRNLNFDEVHGLHEPGGGGHLAGVERPSGGGDNLSATPVDGVGVKGHIIDVEPDTPQVLVAKHALKDMGPALERL